jgi:hypothetical protein
MTMADVSQATADRRIEGSTINTIGQIFGHVVVAEDSIVGGGLSGGLVLMTDGWSEKIGISTPQPRQDAEWANAVIDLDAFRGYARAVFARTDALLASASDADLMKEMDTPLGKLPAIGFISNIGLTHTAQHWGEIAALKGVQGQKGLPF